MQAAELRDIRTVRNRRFFHMLAASWSCPAYPDRGSGCWMLTGVKCQGGEKEFSSLDEQIACCGRCDFYAHASARERLKPGGKNADQEAAGI